MIGYDKCRIEVNVGLNSCPGGGGTPNNGLYEEAPPDKSYFFGLQLYEREGVLLVEVYERLEKSVISVCKMT